MTHQPLARSRPRWVVLALAVVALGIAWGRVAWGVGDAPADLVPTLRTLALERVASAAIVGSALAVAGVYLQSLLRNPLASPDLMGLASGAGLGLTIAIYAGYLAGGGIAWTSAGGPMPTAAAVAGAGGALALVYALSQRRGMIDPITLVLVGVIVGIICSAGMLLLKHLLPDQGVAAQRLLAGALRDDVTGGQLLGLGTLVGVAIAAGVGLGRMMDAASLSEDEAVAVGVPLGLLRGALFVLSGVLAASAVVLAGPIGFVGLICPHAVRLLAGPGHRWLVVGSALAGAALVMGADLLSASLALPSGRLPINVITTLVGGPILVVLLRREMMGGGR